MYSNLASPTRENLQRQNGLYWQSPFVDIMRLFCLVQNHDSISKLCLSLAALELVLQIAMQHRQVFQLGIFNHVFGSRKLPINAISVKNHGNRNQNQLNVVKRILNVTFQPGIDVLKH